MNTIKEFHNFSLSLSRSLKKQQTTKIHRLKMRQSE